MKKKLFQASLVLLLCLFTFSCGKDDGPNEPVDTSPSISGFTPNSGPVGTAVTINGKNFGTTPANNTVKFGTITATVGSASASSLQVTVPEGAQTAKISVSVNGENATSSAAFTVTEEPDPTTVVLDQETLELQTLDTDLLVATVTGAGANETVVWSSDNEESAIVDQEGNVTATGAGTATITATVDGVDATCSITVNPSIFVGGTVESDTDAIGVASYWVNGAKTELNDGDSQEVSLDISGTDVYTTFVEYSVDAIYVRVMKNTSLHSTLGGMDNNYKTPLAIDVVDDDVYVCGFELNGNSVYDAKYWKNGDEIILSDGSDAVGTDIEVHGGSIFASGYQAIGGQYEAFYWKDGTPTQHNTTSDLHITAWDIFIDDLDNVYTAGWVGSPNQNQPYVWKNGEELYILGNGDIEGTAYAVAVENGNVFAVSESTAKECGLWKNNNLVYEWSGYARAMTVLNDTIYVAGTKYDGNINSYTPTVFTFDTSGNLIEEISLPSDGSNGYATSIVVK